jgi:hypothetical protein
MIDIDVVVRTWKKYLMAREIPVCDSDRGTEHENDSFVAHSHSTIEETWLPSYRDVDAFMNSFGEYLCGSSCKGVSTEDAQGVRHHFDRRRKRVRYHERVEIREFTTSSIDHSITSRQYNSPCLKGDLYFAPSFYRHIDKSKHRTARYRPPPIVTLAERKRRLVAAKHYSNCFENFL